MCEKKKNIEFQHNSIQRPQWQLTAATIKSAEFQSDWCHSHARCRQGCRAVGARNGRSTHNCRRPPLRLLLTATQRQRWPCHRLNATGNTTTGLGPLLPRTVSDLKGSPTRLSIFFFFLFVFMFKPASNARPTGLSSPHAYVAAAVARRCVGARSGPFTGSGGGQAERGPLH